MNPAKRAPWRPSFVADQGESFDSPLATEGQRYRYSAGC